MGSQMPENGTLVIAALLVLGLAFAAHWITVAVQPDATFPWTPWVIAAAAIVVIGIVVYARGGIRPGDR